MAGLFLGRERRGKASPAFRYLSAMAVALNVGCTVEGAHDEGETGSLSEALGNAHLLSGVGASETSVSSVGADGRIVMTANKEDVPPWETFPPGPCGAGGCAPGTRRIIPGVTLMGYTT